MTVDPTGPLPNDQLVKLIEGRLRHSRPSARNNTLEGQVAALREGTEFLLALVKRMMDRTTELESRLDQSD
jgi:hypothetical protein